MRVGPMYDDTAVARGCHFVCYLSGACYVDTLSSSGGRELKEDVMVEKGVERSRDSDDEFLFKAQIRLLQQLLMPFPLVLCLH